MAVKATKRTNEDGTSFTVRTVRELVQTRYVVKHSTIPTAGGELVCLDGPMFYAPRGAGGQLVRIRPDGMSYASSDAEGARIALEFFGRSYEDTCKHAAAEGIAVRECFA